jgi:hypothetical protein
MAYWPWLPALSMKDLAQPYFIRVWLMGVANDSGQMKKRASGGAAGARLLRNYGAPRKWPRFDDSDCHCQRDHDPADQEEPLAAFEGGIQGT